MTTVEFYASSDSPNASNVPATVNGSSRPAGTSDWYKLAFGPGVTFAGAKLTPYQWTYTAPATCEQWVDQVNLGDDGQSEADGSNVTGVNACH